jgi:hypothetical protein
MSGLITPGNVFHVKNLLSAIRHEIFNQIYNKKDGKVTGILGARQGEDDKYYNTNELTPEQKEELETLFLTNENKYFNAKQLHTKFNKKYYLSDKSILEFIIKYGTNCLNFPETVPVLGLNTTKYVDKIDESIEYFANNKYATEEIGKILEEQIRYEDPNDNTKTIGLITSIFNVIKLMEETEEIECGKLTDWDDCKTTEKKEDKKIHYRNIAICSFLKGAEKYYTDNTIEIPGLLQLLDKSNFACKYNSKCNKISSSNDKETAKADDLTEAMESLTIDPNKKASGGKRKTKRKNKKSKKSSRKKRKHRKTRKSKK